MTALPGWMSAQMIIWLNPSPRRSCTPASARCCAAIITGESELTVGNLTLNIGRHQAWRDGQELTLTPKEYALLSRLMLKAGSPVHREILYNDIYNWDNEPSTNTLEVHIHNLRDKVGKSRIRTVRGFGYMLVATEES